MRPHIEVSHLLKLYRIPELWGLGREIPRIHKSVKIQILIRYSEIKKKQKTDINKNISQIIKYLKKKIIIKFVVLEFNLNWNY